MRRNIDEGVVALAVFFLIQFQTNKISLSTFFVPIRLATCRGISGLSEAPHVALLYLSRRKELEVTGLARGLVPKNLEKLDHKACSHQNQSEGYRVSEKPKPPALSCSRRRPTLPVNV